ncbi:hypothetical protein [Paraglaciecola sp. L3A3]|uniref:hypothetical protein n=1 Tax=Paraglaciecola sp. L3A3 TaxID=2686358 RepID=UPI00131DE348|nr:hypothetical protein [Paraglaciecola sp. L3A3]
MTDHNKQSEQSLEQLYAKRKSQNLAPLSIKKNLLLKQLESKKTKPILQRLVYVAVAASTLLLFGIFSIQKMHFATPVSHSNILHIHSLTPEPKHINSMRDDINNRYAKRYQEYLSQQQTFAFHHKILAKLELVASGWQLKTCDNQVMLISNELIAALGQINQLDLNLVSGDIVNIAFDSTGIILAIEQSKDQLICT